MLLSFFYGCSKSVYLSSNGKDHLAILPPLVIFEPRKNISNELLKIHETEQSKIFQKEMHAYVLKMKSEKKDNLKIQDPEKTNVILKSNDINSSNISIKDTCGILKVDGVLFSKFSVFNPMPIDNDVIATLSLKDCSSGSIVWKYEKKYSWNIFSTPTSLIELLMSDARKKMPYFD